MSLSAHPYETDSLSSIPHTVGVWLHQLSYQCWNLCICVSGIEWLSLVHTRLLSNTSTIASGGSAKASKLHPPPSSIGRRVQLCAKISTHPSSKALFVAERQHCRKWNAIHFWYFVHCVNGRTTSKYLHLPFNVISLNRTINTDLRIVKISGEAFRWSSTKQATGAAPMFRVSRCERAVRWKAWNSSQMRARRHRFGTSLVSAWPWNQLPKLKCVLTRAWETHAPTHNAHTCTYRGRNPPSPSTQAVTEMCSYLDKCTAWQSLLEVILETFVITLVARGLHYVHYVRVRPWFLLVDPWLLNA